MEKLLKTVNLFEKKSEPEVRLWKAVIGQLVFDAFISSANKKTNLDKKIARQYCENPPWNFSIICNLAGLEPDYVTYKLKQKLNKERLKESGIIWNTKK